MRIAVDARFMGTPGGLGRYVEELVRAMLPAAPKDEFALFLREKGKRCVQGMPIIPVRAEVPWYTLREQFFMPGVAARAGADLVHWTHWNVPLGTPRPFVVTIHDLILLDYPTPRATTLGPLRYALKEKAFHLVLRRALRDAARILVPTMYVRDRLVSLFHIAEQRIVVTGEGLSKLPETTAAEEKEFLQQHDIHSPYILAVGNTYPHKNLEGLLAAHAIIRKQFPTLLLVIAGYHDAFFRRLEEEVRRQGREETVRCIPSPTDTQIVSLYKNASVFVSPAFIEGFGLPPLEAMSVGTPVVASDVASLPEVLGDAALYFDPHSASDIASTIQKVLGDEAVRQAMIQKGKIQVQKWRWQDAAEKTVAVYHEVVSPKQ